MEVLFQDLRHGLRVLRRSPAVTLVSLLILALGVGANVAIFSIVNAALLRRPPYPEPHKLVLVWGVTPNVPRAPTSVPNFLDLRERSTVFSGLAAFNSADAILRGTSDDVERIRCGRVTTGFFDLLGIPPVMGRSFAADEEQPGRGSVVILSHALWKRRFGADPDVMGQKIVLSAKPYTIVGVLPPRFDFDIPGYFRPVELWMPLELPRGAVRDASYLRVIGRLKTDASVERARQDVSRIAAMLASEYPDANAGLGAQVVTWREQVSGDVRPALQVLLGAVGLVLLIACANVASLQLERATLREQEIGLRQAMGAPRGRVVAQLLTESLMLALGGGIVGVLVALVGVRALQGAFPGRIPLYSEGVLELPVLLFAVAVSAGTGVLFGLAPALHASAASLAQVLRAGGRGLVGGGGAAHLRDALIVVEFALSLVLLVGAGLLIGSFTRLLRVSPGFDATNVLTLAVQLPGYAYTSEASRLAFYRQVLDTVRAVPGVQAVGAIDDLPLTPDRDAAYFEIEGSPAVAASELPLAQTRVVTPDYFQVMRIGLVRGRAFSDTDSADGTPVVVINETLARRHYGVFDPVGQRLRLGGASGPWALIIGVAHDVRDLGLDVVPEPEIYKPYGQDTPPYMSFVARTLVDPGSVSATVREAIHTINRDLPFVNVRLMRQVVDIAVAQRRFTTLLMSVFASMAVLLAAVGTYGVVAYWTTQRTHEIGLRLALGARPADIFKLVMGRGAGLGALGIVLGVALSPLVARPLSALVFGVRVADSGTFACVIGLLAAVAAVACWGPARRATMIEPLVALRHE